MAERLSARELADEHLDEYELNSFTKAQAALEKERQGEGCGCNNCLKLVCKTMNGWVDWLGKENAIYLVHYRVKTERGKLVVEEYLPANES